MRKFAVMIIGVSMIFLVLGGAAKQFLNKFKSEKPRTALIRHSPEEAGENIKIREVDSLKVVSNDGQDFMIRVAAPIQMDEHQFPLEEKQVFEFQRQPAPEILPQTEELPRISGKNVVVIKRIDKSKSE